ATDLVATPVSGKGDLYVRDLKKGTTTLVTIDAAGAAGGDQGCQPGQISPNGRFVVFLSYAKNLVAIPVSGQGDVYVRDLQKRTTTLVSVDPAGVAGADFGMDGGAVTDDGRFVVFDGNAGNLVANDGNGTQDVFVRDLRKKA